jgi:O-antigen/teichoic acid export membrane protein
MSRSRSLLANTMVFAITNLVSKFLGFLMLPLYTSILTTEEFGTADLISTTVGILTPLLTLSIANASMRFALDKSVDNKDVFMIGIKTIMKGFLFLIILLPFFNIIPVFRDNLIWFYLLYLSSVMQTYLNLFSRGIGKVKIIGVAGVVNSLVFVIANVGLLYYERLGVEGFLLSYIIANFFGIVVLFFGARFSTLLHTNKTDIVLRKEMLQYTIPLVPNALSWWVNHSSNRYLIGVFGTVADVGLFAAAVRMPSILTTLQSVFIQAWQVSAITEYDKEDNKVFFSKIYSYYSTAMVLGCSILIVATKYIATFLFAKEFYQAWIYTPFLLVSVVFGSMVGFYSSFYLAHKKTKVLFTTTFLGAIITIVLNLILLPFIGIMGAAIANVFAYFSVWLFLHVDSKKFLILEVNFRKFYYIYFLVFIEAVLIVQFPNRLGELLSLILFIIILTINYSNVKGIYHDAKTKILKKNKSI